MSSWNVSVVLVHGAWADGSSWAKVIAPLGGRGDQGGRRAVAADVVPRRCGGPRSNAGADDGAGRSRRSRLCRRRHRGDARREGEGRSSTCPPWLRTRAKPSRMSSTARSRTRRRRSWLPTSHGLIYLPESAFAAAFAQNAAAAGTGRAWRRFSDRSRRPASTWRSIDRCGRTVQPGTWWPNRTG